MTDEMEYTGSTEWELLMIAEDIEQGDTVKVKKGKGIINMVFTGYCDHFIILRNRDEVKYYNPFTLEEKPTKKSKILGKSEEDVRI